jgi:hypothetical protein
MSYRLKALAPCTIFVKGASYRVEAGDRPFLSNEDGTAVLAGPYSDKFVVVEHLEEEAAPPIEEQSVPGTFFSDGTLPMVPSREDGVFVPPTETVSTDGTLAPNTLPSIDDLYEKNKADGQQLLDALTTPKVAKTRSTKPKADSGASTKITEAEVDSGASVKVTDK